MAEPGSATPFQRSTGSTGSAGVRRGRFRRAIGQVTTLSRRRPHRLARRIGIVGRPLAPGALAQHAAQAQEDEHCERQEYDGVDVEHVSHAFGYRTGRSALGLSPGRRRSGRFHPYYVSRWPRRSIGLRQLSRRKSCLVEQTLDDQGGDANMRVNQRNTDECGKMADCWRCWRCRWPNWPCSSRWRPRSASPGRWCWCWPARWPARWCCATPAATISPACASPWAMAASPRCRPTAAGSSSCWPEFSC